MRMILIRTTITGKSIKEITTRANADLESIRLWLKANKLTLNVTKTQYNYIYIFIGLDSSLDKLGDIPYLFLHGKPFNRVKVSKSLGVFIDERLSWRDHTNKVPQVREFVNILI